MPTSIVTRMAYRLKQFWYYWFGCALIGSLCLSASDEPIVRYAENLVIEEVDQGYRVVVKTSDPQARWHYRLIRRGDERSSSVFRIQPEETAVTIPVERSIALSTTHLGALAQIDALESVVGLASFKHPSHPLLRERIEGGAISEIGMNAASNLERIAALQPEVVFTSAPHAADTLLGQLQRLNLNPAVTAAYLEASPLARAEWVLFFGAFYDRLEEAEAAFKTVEAHYLALTKKTHHLSEAQKPSVFTDAPWGDTWWVAGGESYTARLIEDAGGRYVFGDNRSRGGVPLSFESVFAAAAHADFWMNTGAFADRKNLLQADPRFRAFEAVARNRVFGNNRRLNEYGGNDLWERGVTRPDEVLADLIAILHPELLPDHEMIYYQRLQ